MKKKIIILSIAVLSIAVFFNLQLFQYIPGWVAADSNFSLKVQTGPTNPAGGDVVKGTKGLTMLEIEFKSSGSDGLKISSLCVKVQKDGLRWAKKEDLSNFKLYDGDRRLAKITAMGQMEEGIDPLEGKVIFKDLGVYIPKDGSKILTIRGDLSENIDVDEFRVIIDQQCLSLSDITGQKSTAKPKVSGTAEGKYFQITDSFIHLYQPWHGQNWRIGNSYDIGFNYRYLVDRIKLDLIGYREMDQASVSRSFPIVFAYQVDRKLNFDSYQYTVSEDIGSYLDQYRYFKVRATFQIPSGSGLESYESFSSGFFTISDQGIDQGIVEPSGRLIRASADHKVYQIVSGRRLWIPSIEAFNSLGLNFSDIDVVSWSELYSYQNINLVRANSKIYYITEEGLKRHIPNERVFDSYGNRWEDVINISDAQLNMFQDNILIRYDDRPQVYILDNDVKRWVKHASTFNRLGYDWSKVAPINWTEFNSYSTGDSID